MSNSEELRQQAYQRLFDGMKYLEEDALPDSDKLFESAGKLLEQWLRHSDLSERIKEQYTAALAFYLAGQYARAYVIMKNSHDTAVPVSLSASLRMIFTKALPQLQDSVFNILENETYFDSTIAEALEWGDIDEREAIDRIFRATLHRSFALFLAFIDNGQDELLEKAIQLIDMSGQLALDRRMKEEWWVFRTAKLMLEEFHRNSLWVQLQPMLDEDTNGLTKIIVQSYIHSATQRQPPVLELWRSQTIAIQPLNELVENGRPSFCVKMPTGSGKTRIAELAILRSILDTGLTSDRKCLYIAPFRSLAVQIEASLRESFSPFGIHVSELYGGFDVNPAEQVLFDRTRILIATPEKMDALLRFDPKFAQNIKLIVVDEGHIIDSGERGLAYEMFLHRLVRRFERKGIRLLFMSAVIQNIEDFTRWITGKDDTKDGLIESDWSVSKSVLGIIKWDGTQGQSYYTHINLKPIDSKIPGYLHFSTLSKELQQTKSPKRNGPKQTHPTQECFSFIPQPKKLTPISIHRRIFPKKGNKSEIIALAGIQAARDGSTLIFTCKPHDVEAIAKAILEALSLREYIAQYQGIPAETLHLPSKSTHCTDWQEWQACIRFAEDMAGPDSLVTEALQKGVIIHHGEISKKLRVRLEQLARKSIINLIIANNTLIQGVNFPVKTILVHSLHRYDRSKHHRPRGEHLISATDFWNICGRAGRPMKENQGFVFLLADDTSFSKSGVAEQRVRQDVNQYIQQSQGKRLESKLKQFLQSVVTIWSKKYPKASLAELCQRLAANEIDWLSEEERRDLQVIDKHLIAILYEETSEIGTVEPSDIADILENEDFDVTDPQVVQEIFERSLLLLQVPPSNAKLTIQTSVNLLTSRITYLNQIPKSNRKRFYRTGLPIADCQYIEEHWDDILTQLLLANDYTNWPSEERCDYLVNLCKNVLFHLSDVKPSKPEELPDCWLKIVKSWLMGATAETIFQQMSRKIETIAQVNKVIDEMCDFRLPMGFNALYAFMQSSGEDELLEDSVPDVIPYFSALLKYGVHSPVATILLSAGLQHRQAALVLAEHYFGVIEPSSVYNWLYALTEGEVSSWQVDPQITSGVLTFLKREREKEFIEEDGIEPLYSCRIQTSANYISPLSVGMKLFMHSELPNRIKLYTPAIEHLATLRVNDAHFFEQIESDRVHAIIEDIQALKNGHQEIDVRFK